MDAQDVLHAGLLIGVTWGVLRGRTPKKPDK
jgi:hypothetical protein